ncbi:MULTISPECIES: hypothetical protein [unclassified Mucilaginibacter]|uniref:hypothetical protein n=1 Tax=unclassified Mucilaginibacter TaxID=2617802 RepID=UPI002AC96DF7|nr:MULTISPECIES: hypothetical protein [unclassified Mucilaginibacter]MEB0263494.1 hypothetical protein [Mucilaginibacter sp. 10I4]MEB0277079.1 hypothetical protein [Mucilaginibacter sp. 10B2]MEB0301853.1 hypothetical protein [Mucilaginibacter sp. 5C4]WPX25180.1 hypothetical protein RHM67_07855 [Mucilaginibacter sp. 5C4]
MYGLPATENHTIRSYPLVTIDGGKPTMIGVHEANGVDVTIEDAFLLPHPSFALWKNRQY